jgi:hypothetical protein
MNCRIEWQKCWLLILLFCSLIAARDILAQDAIQEHRHRVTGLFSPDGEADLRKLLEEISDIQLKQLDFETSEATFTYNAEQLFNKPKPDQMVERFDQLIRQHSQSTFGIRPLCQLPKEQL